MSDLPRHPGGRTAASSPDEDALVAEVLARRADGREAGSLVGQLLERWRKPAMYVIRRVQQSYRAGTPDDAEELYQEAAFKLVDRGLAQFKGGRVDEGSDTEAGPSSAASGDEPRRVSGAAARVFFLRIVKHTAIDHYRRQREELSRADDADNGLETSAPEVAVAESRARSAASREDAADLYWRAFARLRAEHSGEAEAWEAYHHLDLDDHEACARRLGISIASSYKRISRAQARLRLYLLELADEASPTSRS